MNAKSRKKTEMGTRAPDFSRVHPDASPGYTAAIIRLKPSTGSTHVAGRSDSARSPRLTTTSSSGTAASWAITENVTRASTDRS
jgi:hypothetical protein